MEEGLDALPQASAPDLAESIVRRVLSGECEAFEELMALSEARVLALAWRFLGSRDQAQDVAQEVFLRVYRSLATYRPGESFQAWVYGIAVNVCRDHARKRGPFMLSQECLESAPADPGGHGSAEEMVLMDQRRTMVRQALDSLTPAERSSLVLRDLEGMTTEEVARMLGVRSGTIRSQVSSARSKLQAFCARMMHRTPGGLP